MKISALIRRLTELKNEYGDLPVVSFINCAQGHEPPNWEREEIDGAYFHEKVYARFDGVARKQYGPGIVI